MTDKLHTSALVGFVNSDTNCDCSSANLIVCAGNLLAINNGKRLLSSYLGLGNLRGNVHVHGSTNQKACTSHRLHLQTTQATKGDSR